MGSRATPGRKARERDRMTRAGFKRFECWAHADDWEGLRRHADKLKAKRESVKSDSTNS